MWASSPIRRVRVKSIDSSVLEPQFAANVWAVASDGRSTLRARPPRTPIPASASPLLAYGPMGPSAPLLVRFLDLDAPGGDFATNLSSRTLAAAHVEPDDGSRLIRTNLHQVAQLVDEPEATAAGVQQRLLAIDQRTGDVAA